MSYGAVTYVYADYITIGYANIQARENDDDTWKTVKISFAIFFSKTESGRIVVCDTDWDLPENYMKELNLQHRKTGYTFKG